MIRRLNMLNQTDRARTLDGFTIVELLVVIAIIAVLMGILIPAVMRGQGVAEESSTKQLMNAISMGIIAYERDHNALPPSQITTSGHPMEDWKGGEIICQLMLGHLEQSEDGNDGLGFRKGTKPSFSGRVYGPYVEVGSKFDLGDGPNSKVFADYWTNPICYYKAIAGQNNIFGTNNARFDKDHNDGIDGTDPLIKPGDSNAKEGLDATQLRAADVLIYSRGVDGANNNKQARQDDLIFTGG